MSTRILRATLAGLLIATVGGKIWAAPATNVDMREAVVALIALKGWHAYDEGAGSTKPLGKAIVFQAPECESAGQVFSADLGLQLAPMIDRAIKPGYSRRYIYMGRTWSDPNRLGMRLEWLKNRVLSLLGRSRYVANETVLVVAEPHGCNTAGKLDWSAAWQERTG